MRITNMTARVGLIGVGHVGASVAVSLLHFGAVRELLLHDRDTARAEGEAMDLAQGAPFYPRAMVRTATLDEVVGCDVVVFAAGRNGRPGESRLQLLADNMRVASELGQRLAGSAAIVIAVSNPVDVLTRVLRDTSGLPAARVLGTGTMLDTARLRQRLGEKFGVDSRSVHAQVLAEHGDSSLMHWSGAQVGGQPLRAMHAWTSDDETALATEVRRAAYEIIQRKGMTNHAIGLVTADLVRAVLRDEHRVLTVARQQTDTPWRDVVGEVALSLPAIVGKDGAQTVLRPALDAAEAAGLAQSAAVLQQAWAGAAAA